MRRPSPDELRLWQQAMRDTKPLDDRLQLPSAPDATLPPADQPAPPRANARLDPGGTGPSALADQRLGKTSAQDMDRRTLQRLKRGLVTIDARLDLHGMTQEEAHRHLAIFLAHHQRLGARCILVITGIGGRTTGGTLRRMTPRWLAEPGNAERVLAHGPAQKRHGGEGALYVLLKRLRQR